MKLGVIPILFLLGTGLAPAQFPPQIKNVVIIFQENRTPDNLFHFLTPACPIPPGASGLDACTPSPVTESCYDISPCGLSNENGPVKPVKLKPAPLAGEVDPSHTHTGFVDMCDPDPVTMECRNTGAWRTSVPAGSSYAYVANPPVKNYDGSAGHVLQPYLTLAKQYGWANYMYQTNQGPSYPAHQFMFSGTSAPTEADDAKSIFVAENFNNLVLGKEAGCLVPASATNAMISPDVGATPPSSCTVFPGAVKECPVTNTKLVYPTDPVGSFCFEHKTMANVLDPHAITWKYYSPKPGSIWTAPDSFLSICDPAFENPTGDPESPLECKGAGWAAHVDVQNNGTDILRDIASCDLAQVSWVIPDRPWADHAGGAGLYGPSWVAAVVNAIGNNPKCGKTTKDADQNYWENTAIVITWDDWGGWSDNQPAQYLSKLPCTSTDCPSDYQHGFRVPLIVVSAYTPPGLIRNEPYDFGSVLRMIEGVNHLAEGQLGFADRRAVTDLREFFRLTQPRTYVTVPAEKDASFFLTWTAAAADPDDD
jgi:phospholipase C